MLSLDPSTKQQTNTLLQNPSQLVFILDFTSSSLHYLINMKMCGGFYSVDGKKDSFFN